MADAFPFASSTSSKAEHISQSHRHRHMHTHTEDTDTAGHTVCHRQGATFKRQHTHTGLTPDSSPDSHVPSSSWAGRGRRSLVQHTHHSSGSQAHAHSWIPPGLSQPLCPLGTPARILAPFTHPTGPRLTGWSNWVLAANIQHSHTHPTGTPHSQVPPNTTTDLLPA